MVVVWVGGAFTLGLWDGGTQGTSAAWCQAPVAKDSMPISNWQPTNPIY